ncbi:hypothetical protein [Pluralibacter sp.]|uniref:hypothetical protein n=1 Tax=Pluralibacter sp. TaxID=1920032 RepID=UPI0025D54AD6|nr:hypothetical protein [Pluralibacter sp.]MBV8042219.1 hypothetical protein [Pluralibacter sp.]
MSTYPHYPDPCFPSQLLTRSLSASDDLFGVLDLCTALVSVLVETDDCTERVALCGRLVHSLTALNALCEADLPPHLISSLTTQTLTPADLPDCWQDTAMLLGYLQTLVNVLLSNTQPEATARDISGLLHDLTWLLADSLKTPFILSA